MKIDIEDEVLEQSLRSFEHRSGNGLDHDLSQYRELGQGRRNLFKQLKP